VVGMIFALSLSLSLIRLTANFLIYGIILSG
jgi:hypothetical protein